MRKKYGALLLCLCLLAGLLAGCDDPASSTLGVPAGGPAGAAASSDKMTGGYVEQALLPNQDDGFYGWSIFTREDGKLMLSGRIREQNIPAAYTSADGENWVEEDNSALENFGAGFSAFTIIDGTRMADGTWWVVATPLYVPDGTSVGAYTEYGGAENMEAGEETIALYRVAPGQQPQQVEVPIFEEMKAAGLHLTLAGISQSTTGRLCLDLNEESAYAMRYCLVLDGTTGEQVTVIELDTSRYFGSTSVLHEDKVYRLDRDNVLHGFDVETGREADSWQAPQLDQRMSDFKFAVEADGSFSYIDRYGVHRQAKGGSMAQNLVEGSEYVFAGLHFSPHVFFAAQDGSYLTFCVTDEGKGLYRYVFDENYRPNEGPSITVWALEESLALRAAASAYSKANPDIRVNLEFAREQDTSGATDEDIVRALNTRILGEDAPDVLILDGLPIESYIKSGILEELTGQLDVSGCYDNIMKAYVRGGKAWAYPTLFQMPLFFAKAGDAHANGVETLVELAVLAKTPGNLYYGSYYNMFDALYAAYSNELFPQAAQVNEEAVRTFLASTAEITAALELTAEDVWQHGGVDNSGVLPPQGFAAYKELSVAYAADIVMDPPDATFVFEYGGAQAISPLPGKGYLPKGIAGIPANAPNKEAALSFIQLMLEDEGVQSSNLRQGFSVHKEAYQPYFERVKEMETIGFEPLTHAADYDWEALIAQLEQPTVMETVLRQKLLDQAEKLYRGDIGLDTAVQGVLQNTKLYFDERV